MTTKTYENKPYFLDKICCNIVVEELDFYRKKHQFKILGYVIMPDHLHLVVWWDAGENKDLRISRIIDSFKTMTSKRIKRYLFFDGGTQYSRNLSNTPGGLTDVGQPTRRYLLQPDESGCSHLPHRYGLKYKIWQPGYYDFNIISEEKLWEKLDYMHENPFKDKRIKTPEHYEYCSRLFFEEGKGILNIDVID